MPTDFKTLSLEELLQSLMESTQRYDDAVANKEDEIIINLRKESVEVIKKSIADKKCSP